MKSTFVKNISLLILALALTEVTTAQTIFKLPSYEKYQLPNGLTIYLMERHTVPLVSFSAIIPAGAVNDGERHGIASLTANGLLYGTRSYIKAQIEEQLDFIVADLHTRATKEYTAVTAKFATKDIDKALPILSEVISAPTFSAVEFEKEKIRTLALLEQDKQSPQKVISSYWDHFIYGSQVYGNSISGSPATVGKLTPADLKAFYKANYTPGGSAIAVVGDFDGKAIKLKLASMFGVWKKSDTIRKANVLDTITAPMDPRVLLVNKEDARETTFLIGGLGIQRNNPDFIAIDVVNTLFGGRFTSMLNDELRVNSGLTYGARSRFIPFKDSGTFYIATFTANKTTAPTLEKAVAVLNKLHKDGIDEQSLTSAKNYVKGQFPPNYETPGQLAGLLTQMFWYSFDESFINNFQANVDKLDLAGAKAIIVKYYPKKNLQFVMIGKAAELRPIAEKYGKVVEKQIKDDGF